MPFNLYAQADRQDLFEALNKTPQVQEISDNITQKSKLFIQNYHLGSIGYLQPLIEQRITIKNDAYFVQYNFGKNKMARIGVKWDF